MKPRIPESSLCERFDELVSKAREDAVKEYLESAYFAFKDGHLEASIVLAWAAVERYCSLVIEDIGRWYFELHSKETGKIPNEHTSPTEFAKLSERTRIFRGFFESIENLRSTRNKVAHGSGVFLPDPNQVLEFISEARSIYHRDRYYEKFSNPEDLHDFIAKFGLPENFDKFVSHFPVDCSWEKMCRKIYTHFLNDEKPKVESLKPFCHYAFGKLEPDKKLGIWRSYADMVISSFMPNDDEFIKKERFSTVPQIFEIFDFLPAPDDSKFFDTRRMKRFLRYFIDEIDLEIARIELVITQSNTSISDKLRDEFSPVKKIARKINRIVPENFEERWKKIYERCKNLNSTLEGTD